MTKINGELFADAQFTNVLIQVPFLAGETQKDVMPLLLKKDFNYLYKTQIMPQGKALNLVINGIDYSSGAGIIYLDNVLIESLIVKNPTGTVTTIPMSVNYCL